MRTRRRESSGRRAEWVSLGGSAVGWEDRGYSSQPSFGMQRAVRSLLGSIVPLLVLHALAFGVLAMMRFEVGQRIAVAFPLTATSPSLSGVLLHPVATPNLFTLLMVLWAIWALGRRVEADFGVKSAYAWYLSANLVAGLVFWLLARAGVAGANMPLEVPAGALTAWGVMLWQQRRNAPVSVFGFATTEGAVLAALAVGTAVLALARGGVGGLPWLLAAAAGGATVLAPRAARVLAWRRRRVASSSSTAARPSRVAPRVGNDVDDLLAKISREGLASLTAAERDRLESARQARLRAQATDRNVR